MKAKKWIGFAVIMVCLCFIFMGNSASAASVSVNKIAYVDEAAKRLVLKYEDFSDSGYTYAVTNTTTGNTVASGSVSTGTNVLHIVLGDNYVSNNKYQLSLNGNNGDTLTVYYLTGEAVSGLSAAKQSDNSLLTTWTVSNASMYSGYKIQLAEGDSSAAVLAEAEVDSGKGTSKTFASSALTTASYTIHLIGYRSVDGEVYYGQGLTINYDYVIKPGKVTGVTATAKANAAKLSWNAVSGASYYTIYKCKKSAGTYKVAKTNVTETSTTVEGLSAGKTWYFKVVAVSAAGSSKSIGSRSTAVSAYIPVVAGQVKNVTITLDSNNNLALKWDKTTNATGYRIYYKAKGDLTYKKLGTTKTTTYSLDKLDSDTKYNIEVRAYTKVGSKKYLSSKTSKTITLKPSKYLKKNYNKLLASQVRTIGYVGTTKCIYTTKKYSTAVKTAFVNYKGYSSKTKYLIWISHYTQQVSIFEGSKGNWKMIRTFICATGTAKNHSPIGVYSISYKETGWFYANSKELYVTHWCGRNSFHTRPLYNSGAVKTATIGKPASHGCVRCYNQDAKYIYDNMPIGTTVVSY